jgi:hypothetical protein
MSANEKPAADRGKPTPTPNVQGEGDYESARKFDKDEADFVKSADVSDLARKAAPKNKQEAEELKKAEEMGRSHSADKR